jgi:nifR3 family TIM-barrel protein
VGCGEPLRIGPRIVPSRYFLAPLAGYTQVPFRRAIRELGGLGLATTDLVHATMLLSGRPRSLDVVTTHPEDQPLSVQLFGGDSAELVKAARWLEAHGYSGVDLNMGCPMARINSHGGGARLMCDTEQALRMAAAVVEAVSLPVTVKMRLGWDDSRITAPHLARELEQVGVAAITVHGRTRQQGFHGSVNLTGIRDTVAAVKQIPVIGNGDVRTPEDARRMRQVTGCAAVAIGRGAMLDPWIFHKLAGGKDPTAEAQIAFLHRHGMLMAEQHGAYGCLLLRKFAGWYGARLGIPEELEDRLRRLESWGDFEQTVREIPLRHGQRRTDTPTALLKVPNGPQTYW